MNDARRARKRFERKHRHSTLDQVMVKGGKQMAIIRPLDPALALRLVSEIPEGTPHEESKERFDRILDAQPYRFMGLASKPVEGMVWILHPQTLKRTGKVEPGDSFVDHDVMQREAVRIPPFQRPGPAGKLLQETPRRDHKI